MDPIHEENGKWYFWDETWADRYGPYPTKEMADENLNRYCDWLDTGIMSPKFVEEIVDGHI